MNIDITEGELLTWWGKLWGDYGVELRILEYNWFSLEQTVLNTSQPLVFASKLMHPERVKRPKVRPMRQQTVAITTYPPIYVEHTEGGSGPSGPRSPRVFPAIYFHDELSEQPVGERELQYKYWRLYMLDGGGQGGEGVMVGTHTFALHTVMSGPDIFQTVEQGLFVASASAYSDKHANLGLGSPELAFDGRDDTGWWLDGNAANHWIQVELSEPRAIKQYSVGAYPTDNATTDRSLKTWKLQVSDDGVSWETVHSVVGEVFAGRTDIRRYTL